MKSKILYLLICCSATVVGCGGGGSDNTSTQPEGSASSPVYYSVSPAHTNSASTPSTTRHVIAGGTTSFSVMVGSGHSLSPTVTGTCPAGAWAGNVYTTGTITGNCTVEFSGVPKDVFFYQTQNAYNGNFGDRAATTAVCQASRSTYGGSAACTNYIALVGYSTDRGIQDIEANYGVPMQGALKLLDGTDLGGTLQDFIDTAPPLVQGAIGHPDGTLWSGFNPGGGASANNCNDWQGGGVGDVARILNSLNQGWNDGGLNCSSFSQHYFCACW